MDIWDNCTNTEESDMDFVDPKYSKPLTLADLSKAYELLKPYKNNYDAVAMPQDIIKKIPQKVATAQEQLFGIKVITIPEEKRKGLFKWKLFRLLFSSTRSIIKEWYWNNSAFLISTKACKMNMRDQKVDYQEIYKFLIRENCEYNETV